MPAVLDLKNILEEEFAELGMSGTAAFQERLWVSQEGCQLSPMDYNYQGA